MSKKHQGAPGEPSNDAGCDSAVPPVEPSAEKAEEQAAPAPEISETDKLRAEVEELKAKILYLTADYQNYRKRAAKDIADARVFGTINALEAFLRTFDFLAMARDAAEKSDNTEAIRQGVVMILGEYEKALNDLGVSRFSAVGKPFDPALHDAAAHEPSDAAPEGQVLKEWYCGYKMGDRLIRPAKVIVSSGPAAPADAPETQTGETPEQQ